MAALPARMPRRDISSPFVALMSMTSLISLERDNASSRPRIQPRRLVFVPEGLNRERRCPMLVEARRMRELLRLIPFPIVHGRPRLPAAVDASATANRLCSHRATSGPRVPEWRRSLRSVQSARHRRAPPAPPMTAASRAAATISVIPRQTPVACRWRAQGYALTMFGCDTPAGPSSSEPAHTHDGSDRS